MHNDLDCSPELVQSQIHTARLHNQIVGWRADLLQNLSLSLTQGQLFLLQQWGALGAGALGSALGLGDGAQYRS